MKRNQRDKKTPMFESAIPTNYDFVDYTEAEKRAAQEAHKDGLFGHQEKTQMEGPGQSKMKSIFDQLVETKEHDVELPEQNVKSSQQQSFSKQQQYGSIGQVQNAKTSSNYPKVQEKFHLQINSKPDFANFPPPPGYSSDRNNNTMQSSLSGKNYSNIGNNQHTFSYSATKKENPVIGLSQQNHNVHSYTAQTTQNGNANNNNNFNKSYGNPNNPQGYSQQNYGPSLNKQQNYGSSENYGSPQTYGSPQPYGGSSSQYQSPQQPAKSNLTNSQHTSSYQSSSITSSNLTQSTKVPVTSSGSDSSGGYSDPALLALLPESTRANILSMIQRSKNSK